MKDLKNKFLVSNQDVREFFERFAKEIENDMSEEDQHTATSDLGVQILNGKSDAILTVSWPEIIADLKEWVEFDESDAVETATKRRFIAQLITKLQKLSG